VLAEATTQLLRITLEWCERRLDQHETHIVDVVRRAWAPIVPRLAERSEDPRRVLRCLTSSRVC
jgi:hypothetical protein